MDSFQFRLAAFVMRHRMAATIFFILVTIFFGVGLFKVQLKTIFSDLLPADDPYVQVFQDHPNFGNPLTMTVMIKRTDGKSIYNADTLAKVWDMTRDIDLTPAVDHDQVLSIASSKARYAEATPFGIDIKALMGASPPKTEAELEEFRSRVDKSPGSRRFLISQDETAAIVQATFIERLLDYGVAFSYVQDLVEKARDENHEVHLAGQPALTGWVYYYEVEMLGIFMVTLTLLILALVFYMRNVVGVLVPIVTSATAAIWGFGLVGWLESPIEPLLMVVPLLLVARSFSHSVQFIERFYEVQAHVGDRKKAAEITMGVMLAPSVLGICTDSIGIFLIAMAPIPAMERFAFFAGMWSMWLIPTGVFMISLLLSALPPPRNVDAITGADGNTGGIHGLIRTILLGVSRLVKGKAANVTALVVLVGGAFMVYTSLQIKIGNPVEGSNLLWPDSEFNTAVRNINSHFPGVNTLEVIIEAKDEENPKRVAQQFETVETGLQFQYLMEHSDAPPKATLSFSDYMMEGNRLFQGGNPKWLAIDPTDRHSYGASMSVLQGTSPKTYSHVVDFELQNSTLSLWYPDNKQETVDAALAAATKVAEQVEKDHPAFRIRVGTGTIALQQAVNLVVERFHYVILGFLNIAILILCTIGYRSPMAGFFLLIPVNLSNAVLTATMHLMGIGLDINSLMVAVIGVGVGIDYGIYLLSRICEEFHAHDDWGDTLTSALTTTGKAILFTATIMLLAIMPWYFMSGLKFTADMGLLLVFIMLINMVLALVVLPLLVWMIKPKFVSRTDLLVSESVDLSAFTDAKGDERLDPQAAK